jgi:hypothetical protein
MKINTLLCLSFAILLLSSAALGQTGFLGKIKYKVAMLDTTVQQLIDDREMIVYTNDTLSRMEIMNDALGMQVSIKHLGLKKSYLLMDFLGKKLAIQTDQTTDSTKYEPYEIKYKLFGKKKINGLTLKKATIYRADLKEERIVWYFKNIRPDLLDYYPGIKGLPADFYVGTIDGIIHYSLLTVESRQVEKDMFGIPSNYEKITLSDFLDKVKQVSN